jgi:hypothetical protein
VARFPGNRFHIWYGFENVPNTSYLQLKFISSIVLVKLSLLSRLQSLWIEQCLFLMVWCYSEGSSSIGTSLDAHFLAAFSAAAGKRSIPSAASDESDPEVCFPA